MYLVSPSTSFTPQFNLEGTPLPPLQEQTWCVEVPPSLSLSEAAMSAMPPMSSSSSDESVLHLSGRERERPKWDRQIFRKFRSLVGPWAAAAEGGAEGGTPRRIGGEFALRVWSSKAISGSAADTCTSTKLKQFDASKAVRCKSTIR